MTKAAPDAAATARGSGASRSLPPDPRRWYALVLLCLAPFIDTLGFTSVFSAGPTMERALGLTQTGLQWTFTAATLPALALLLAGGRLCDTFGRRRMFMAGVALLTLSSLACGLAPSTAVLITARAGQGMAAGLLLPAALSLITSTFPAEQERNKALAVWSAVSGTGATAGLLLGGVITVALGWQWIFFINVPTGAALLLLSPVLLREPPADAGKPGAGEPGAGGQARRVDVAGTATITCGVALFIYTITAASQQGWGSPRTVGGLCASAVLVAAFARIESRAKAPMLPPGLLGVPSLVAGNLVLFTAGVAVDGMIFTLTLYSQRVLGYSALQFAGITAIMTASSVVAAPIAQRAVTRFGHRPAGHAGLAMLCLSDAGLAVTTALGGSPVAIAGCMLLFGLGMGCAFVPGTIASLEGVPDEDSGIAAAIQNTSFGLGTTIGVAILSAISAAAIHGPRPGGQGYLLALASGYRMAFIGGAVLCALGLAVSTAARRRPDRRSLRGESA